MGRSVSNQSMLGMHKGFKQASGDFFKQCH